MRILLLLFLLSFSVPMWGQSFDDDFERRNIPFMVKQYDEFIERFNFDSDARIVKYLKKNYPESFARLTRETLIKSLFNLEDPDWNQTDVNAFLQRVVDPMDPLILDFYDTNWYAEVHCEFDYQDQEFVGSIILEHVFTENYASKWQVVGVIIDFLPEQNEFSPIPPGKDPMTILSPMSHATDFAALHRAFKDRDNLVNYFSPKEWSPGMSTFVNELRSGKLCLEETMGVTYHLLQIDDWIVTLKDYNRNLPNSGILISSITAASQNDKEGYRKKRLNID